MRVDSRRTVNKPIAKARGLQTAGIAAPEYFTTALIFRRCDACGARNIVKDDWYYCGVCDAPLSQHWNFAQ